MNSTGDGLAFNSGDGVAVDIVEIKSRLKSPESMFTKLGKNVEGEVHDIRDILAITFIINNRDDTLKLFHALQKRGVILQENTISPSITQTLFHDPESMVAAVRSLMADLSGNMGNTGWPGTFRAPPTGYSAPRTWGKSAYSRPPTRNPLSSCIYSRP